jgi:hypothetical protein
VRVHVCVGVRVWCGAVCVCVCVMCVLSCRYLDVSVPRYQKLSLNTEASLRDTTAWVLYSAECSDTYNDEYSDASAVLCVIGHLSVLTEYLLTVFFNVE